MPRPTTTASATRPGSTPISRGVVTPTAVTRPYTGAAGPSDAANTSCSHAGGDRTCAPPGRQVMSRPLQHDRGVTRRAGHRLGPRRGRTRRAGRRPYEQAPQRRDRVGADALQLVAPPSVEAGQMIVELLQQVAQRELFRLGRVR